MIVSAPYIYITRSRLYIGFEYNNDNARVAPLLLSHKNGRKKSINVVLRNILPEEWDRTLPTFKERAISRLLVHGSRWGWFCWQLNSHTYYIFEHPGLWKHLFWSKIAIPPQNPLTGSHQHRPLERKLKKSIKSFKRSVLRTRSH